MNSSLPSSTRKPGIDSSLSSVPPVWPSPRPLILANGTPHAATIGPITIDALSPTPPVECLSTTFRPSADRSITSPLRTIASVSAWVSAAVSPRKYDGHAERGHLVVRHVVPRVGEHEGGELLGGELLAVPLAPDQLGGVRSRLRRRESRNASARRLSAEPGVHGRADVGELPVVALLPPRFGPPRTPERARARASGRSKASSGRSRGRT